MCGDGSLMLKCWHASFDLTKEHILLRHLWVLLLGSPLQFCNVATCEAIGNDLCRFLYVDQEKL